MLIKTYTPYIFVLIAFLLFGVWSRNNLPENPRVERAIASDCDSLVKELISPKVDDANSKAFKFRNNIWNKIVSNHEFENFNDKEYFRWMEIYKDAKSDLSNVNPVSIEQKMALIEVINARLIPTVLSPSKNLSKETQNLNALKLRKLKMHMSRFDLSSKLIRESLDDFAADLMFILKGPPTSLLDYFTTNKTKQMNERLMRIVQEDMLVLGLRGMIERIPEKNSYTQLERGKSIVKKIFQSKAWKYLVIPYDLPWIERVQIPEELLEKIMLDGLEAHNQELIELLKKQNMIDHYERFRKVYKPIAFSIGFYFYYDKFQNNGGQEDEKNKFLEEFKNLADAIEASSSETIKSDATMKQEQFNRVLNAFREKYKEEPTPEEYQEMKDKIFGH